MAKDLAGNFANLRPDNPARFMDSLATVLEQYPAGVARECVDPVNGLAKHIEFLSLKATRAWCDERLAFYQAVASHVPVKRLAGPALSEAQRADGHAAWVGLLHTLTTGGDVAALTFETAQAIGRKRMAPA